MSRDIRTDSSLGTVVHIVADRQNRPNLPIAGCPFCVGGLEAPDAYTVKAFPNRWPALAEGYCEVVLYTPHHDATFGELGIEGILPVINLWAQRTEALRQQPDGEYVVIFENRGSEIGATISHPHGQIYAFDHVPSRPLKQLEAHWTPDTTNNDRIVLETPDWVVYTEQASVHPVQLRIAPTQHLGDLVALTPLLRTSLAVVLAEIFTALDELFNAPLPYMMWINQAPRSSHTDAWLNFEIVSPWRSAGVPRYIAAVEVATEEYFNPVDPGELAHRLRALLP